MGAAAAGAAACQKCGERGRHRRDCPEWPAWDAARVALVHQIDEMREERAAGRRSVRSAVSAVRWYYLYRESQSAARGLPLDPNHEGDGRPNRGADDPKRRLFAAVAWAIKKAEEDDRERHPEQPAPLARWLAEHIAGGRAYTWMADAAGWTELEVAGRVERALRVIRQRLKDGTWLEGREA